ncbi:heterokaryon incompatibility protein-domain-containing protein [Ilyonectria robusta]|uniref:heterokaryon incompatibility protein-domain-containing protein n=1 Tax=Ilyonectria robusta TaxID=1079257 RepID=UPI001E8D4FBD|nr:heterokaryon incompatibility protein-domain-containing protein [Ilyonectria robusta]KAH8706255.1 heterokaryon incompatibility protein-domain-containing protein [Ilyonectria robusta]
MTDMDVADAITDDSLCPSCFHLDTAAAVEYDSPDIFVDQRSLAVVASRSFDHIQTTAASGCHLCAFLLKVVDFFGFNPEADRDHSNIVLRLPIGFGNPEISFPVYDSKLHAQLYGSTQDRPWGRIQPLPDICTDQLSADSLWFMKTCLETCQKSHHLCQQNDGIFPTRLLDVGTRDDKLVRLVESTSDSSMDYIALSYCWGNSVSIKTTSTTLGKMKSGVEMAELPQTYIDAVSLTRELGIRYLWIDALCIIQDCFQDWEKESTIMGGIYSKALLTIAATSSSSVGEPFLQRDTTGDSSTGDSHPSIFSDWINVGEDSSLIKARLISTSGVHWRWYEDKDPTSTDEPLSRRGWTLQERLLSTRLLSISKTEIQWICQESVTCECQSNLNYRRDFGLTPVRQITLAQDAYDFWHKVVESYTARDLTKPKDKLPAISAIAAAVQQKIGSDYAAGLWTDNIHLDLLWRSRGPRERRPQTEFIAPSFSWASIDGEVDYYCFRNGKKPYHKISSVVSVETSANPEAPLGRVRGGSLTISAPLVPCYVEEAFSDGWIVIKLGSAMLEMFADTALQEFVLTTEDDTVQKYACRWSPLNKAPQLWETKRSSSGPAGIPQPVSSIGHCDDRTHCWAIHLGSFSLPTCHELLIVGKSQTIPGAYERIALASWEGGPDIELFEQKSPNMIKIV